MTVPPPTPPAETPRWHVFAAGSALVAAILAVYGNSRAVPFLFDDPTSITDNPTIRHFSSALSPPPDLPVGGRPLVNLSYALNYALNGESPFGYHIFNVLIHAAAALALFGLLRRIFRDSLRLGRDSLSGHSTALALAVAALWALHPVQTETVTYITQRAEALAGLCYLLCLYCFIRGARSPRALGWYAASILACWLGALCKEMIITAPVVVLLCDRTFVAGTFRGAWQSRWRYYLGLAGVWPLLAWLGRGLDHRGGGFGLGVSAWSYALTSCRSLVRYLRLTVWPHPLIFDYSHTFLHHATEAVPFALILVPILAVVAIGLVRRPAAGFAGATFFILLSPTTSFYPLVFQPMAENRLYLPLAPAIALVVIGLYRSWGRRSLMVLAAAALGLGCLSVRRNQDYRSGLSIWSDTVAKAPDSPYPRLYLAIELAKVPGRMPDAVALYEEAVRLKPDYIEARNNLANALASMPGRMDEALENYAAVLRLEPGNVPAHINLANALAAMPGRMPDALAHYDAALRIDPHAALSPRIRPYLATAHYNMALELSALPGRLPEAIDHYEAALRINPDFLEAQNNLANALETLPGRLPEALQHFQAALRINPRSADVHFNYAMACLRAGRLGEARQNLEQAVQLNPSMDQARDALARLPARPAGDAAK